MLSELYHSEMLVFVCCKAQQMISSDTPICIMVHLLRGDSFSFGKLRSVPMGHGAGCNLENDYLCFTADLQIWFRI